MSMCVWMCAGAEIYKCVWIYVDVDRYKGVRERVSEYVCG